MGEDTESASTTGEAGSTGEGTTAGELATEVTLEIQRRDQVASEQGTLTLVGGALQLDELALVASDHEFIWLSSPARVDLAVDAQTLEVNPEVPPGVYERVRVRLRPSADEPAFDAWLEHPELGSVRVQYAGMMEGETYLGQAVEVQEGETPALSLVLQAAMLTFYLWPYDDAEDGVFAPGPGETGEEQLRLNLSNMWLVGA